MSMEEMNGKFTSIHIILYNYTAEGAFRQKAKILLELFERLFDILCGLC